jgi:hypothetical protein
MSKLSALVTRLLPVVVSVVVVIDGCLTFVVVTVVVVSMFELFVVDFSVVAVVVIYMFELLVVDFSETGVCGELCGASDVSIFSVVSSVVIGASQTIRKTCEWSLLLSEIFSCVEHK